MLGAFVSPVLVLPFVVADHRQRPADGSVLTRVLRPARAEGGPGHRVVVAAELAAVLEIKGQVAENAIGLSTSLEVCRTDIAKTHHEENTTHNSSGYR